MNLFYTYDIFGGQRYGGISRYYFELIRRISARMSDVQVLAGLYINEYINSLPNVAGLKVPQWKFSNSIRLKISGIFQRIMLSRANSETIVHQTYYFQPIINFKGKVVVTIFDMIYEKFPQYYPANYNISQLKRRCCERADKIIAISHSTKNDLVGFFGVSPEKIVVVYLASSLKSNNAPSRVRPFSEPYLLFVGKREYYKNFAGLLQAFATSDSLKENFRIVCFGGEPVDSDEKERLKELGIAGRVHYIRGDDGLLCNYYRNAAAFVCPSLYEGFGIPVLEAMEFSCPVICSNTSSIPEVAGEAAVYFDPSDPASMQQALENTLFDQELLNDLKKRGLGRQASFSWDRCAEETLAVYHSLLA